MTKKKKLTKDDLLKFMERIDAELQAFGKATGIGYSLVMANNRFKGGCAGGNDNQLAYVIAKSMRLNAEIMDETQKPMNKTEQKDYREKIQYLINRELDEE